MLQINVLSGTVQTDSVPNEETGKFNFYFQSAIDKEGAKPLLFFVSMSDDPQLKTGDRVIIRGDVVGDDKGRPFIREASDGSVWTVFDFECYKVVPMDKDFQLHLLVGNLGKDPDMRYVGDDAVAVTSFSFATNSNRKLEDGTWSKNTIWWRPSAWRNTAETLFEKAKKGMRLLMEISLTADPETGTPRTWESEQWGIGTSYEATVLRYRFLDKVSGERQYTPDEIPENQQDDIPF